MEKEIKFTQQQLVELERSVVILRQAKSIHTSLKTQYQHKIGPLKDIIKDINNSSEVIEEARKEREQLKLDLISVENKISQVNNDIALKNKALGDIKYYLKHQKKSDNQNIVIKMQQLRNKYQKHSTDRTRIASTRVMASEFVIELDKILEDYE